MRHVSEEVRLVFATDIHGSNACFRKVLSAFDQPDAPQTVVVGGDVTGKDLLVIVERDPDCYELINEEGRTVRMRGDEVDEVERAIADKGLYTYICDPQEAALLKIHRDRRDSVLERLQVERLSEWLAEADRRLAGTDKRLIMNAGNDDPFCIDQVLESAAHVIRPEGKLIRIGSHLTMISTGFTTETPWNTPREVSDEALQKIIAESVASVPDTSKCIFNFHCPPRDTRLDLAPKLDENKRPVATALGMQWEHVGAKSVRDAIVAMQPVAALHGHIHEQHAWEYVGRTWCCNPGSAYSKGILQSAFLMFRDGRLVWRELRRDMVPLSTDTRRGLVEAVLLALPFGKTAVRLLQIGDASRSKSSPGQSSP